jgi:hypothetical protein
MAKLAFVGALAGLFWAAAVLSPGLAREHVQDHAQDPRVQDRAVPDFSANGVGWSGDGENEFIPPKSGPGPVTSDPAHPYVSNFLARRTGAQPNWRVADLANPNLKPWVVEALRKQNADALAGKAMFTREARCWPQGVPAMLLNPGMLFFVQTPKQVWIIQEADHRVRRIYLDQPHSENPTSSSWYGESVGHYEGGDTLVVDTIGMNDRTFVDSYNTPHTTAIHVVERFKLVDGGRALQVDFTVDDPGAFNTPWSAGKRFKRERAGLAEEVCAENNKGYFNYPIEPLPQANKPDF